MCVGQYSYLRSKMLCGNYILHLGENIVYTFFGCCTYYYNLPEVARQRRDGGIVKNSPKQPLSQLRCQLPLHRGGQIIIISATPEKSIDNILTKV